MSNKVMHTYSDHLITRQNRAEKEFLAVFGAENDFTDDEIKTMNKETLL